MEKKSETVSVRVTPLEKEVVFALAEHEQRKVSDALHRLIFAGKVSQHLQSLHDRQKTA